MPDIRWLLGQYDVCPIVASEIIATFSADVLPTAWKFYYGGGNEEANKKQCKEFAAEVGLPLEHWALITHAFCPSTGIIVTSPSAKCSPSLEYLRRISCVWKRRPTTLC
jgi:hypothetical protein